MALNNDRSFWIGVAAGAAAGVALAGGATAFALSRTRGLSGRTKEERLLQHVFAHAQEGNASSVLKAIDDYCWHQAWLMNVGDVKGRIVEAEVCKAAPRLALEFGGYMGYSAILIGSLLPEGGRLVSIEINPVYAAFATKLVEYAGLAGKVSVMVSDVQAALPRLVRERGQGTVDLVFIDHWKDRYLPDMKALESSSLLHPGSVVIADNVKYPGAPDYRAYMTTSPAYHTVLHETELEYQPSQADLITVSTVL